jgi:ABC-type sugar transport system substrate-binding protein
VIDPIVSTGWDTVLGEAQDAGIPVVVIDRTIDDSDKYVAWIGTEFKNEGLAAGAWLKEYAARKASRTVTSWSSRNHRFFRTDRTFQRL